jgi:hypothetical protein
MLQCLSKFDPFMELFVLTMELIDKICVDLKASYMDFPKVLNVVQNRLIDAFDCNPCDLFALRRLLR